MDKATQDQASMERASTQQAADNGAQNNGGSGRQPPDAEPSSNAARRHSTTTSADRPGGDRSRASAAETATTTSSTTQCDERASQASSASACTAANKDKGGSGDADRSKTQRGEETQRNHKPSSSVRQQQQLQRDSNQAKAQRGDQLARAGGAGRGCQRRGLDRPMRQVDTGSATPHAVATPNTNTPTDVILRWTSAPRMRWTRQNRTQPRHPKHQEYWKWTWSKEAAVARGAPRPRREGHAPSSSPGEVSGKAIKHQNKIKIVDESKKIKTK